MPQSGTPKPNLSYLLGTTDEGVLAEAERVWAGWVSAPSGSLDVGGLRAAFSGTTALPPPEDKP
jgi:hypothetical protein